MSQKSRVNESSPVPEALVASPSTRSVGVIERRWPLSLAFSIRSFQTCSSPSGQARRSKADCIQQTGNSRTASRPATNRLSDTSSLKRAKEELAEDDKLLQEHVKNVEGLKWLKQELYKKDKPA